MLRQPSLAKCGVCGREVSTEAKACTHCGHPVKKRKHRGAVVVAVAVVAVIFGSYFMWGFITGFIWGFEGHPGLPSCQSSEAQSGAKRAFDNSPFAKTFGVAIIGFSDEKTVSSSPEKVGCKATVVLNSSEKGVIDYSFSKDPSLPLGKYYIRAFLETGTLRSYP